MKKTVYKETCVHWGSRSDDYRKKALCQTVQIFSCHEKPLCNNDGDPATMQ